MFRNFFENCAVYTTMQKKYNRTRHAADNNIIRRMHIACWISNVKNIHSEYVIFIASPLQHWLHARASMLGCAYVAVCPVIDSALNFSPDTVTVQNVEDTLELFTTLTDLLPVSILCHVIHLYIPRVFSDVKYRRLCL
jgi:hypothetical protein